MDLKRNIRKYQSDITDMRVLQIALQDSMDTKYYTFGTRRQLKERGVITKDGWFKSYK